MAAAVVAHRALDVRGNLLQVLQQGLDRLALELLVGGERGVELVHVGLMMLVVVDAHGLLIDVRLKRVIGVRQGRQLVFSDRFQFHRYHLVTMVKPPHINLTVDPAPKQSSGKVRSPC